MIHDLNLSGYSLGIAGTRVVMNPSRVLIRTIQDTVAEYFGTDPKALRSRGGTRDIVRQRQIAMYLARTITNQSFPEIGRRFGGFDHTTVMHAVKAVPRLMRDDEDLRLDINRLHESLAGVKPFWMDWRIAA